MKKNRQFFLVIGLIFLTIGVTFFKNELNFLLNRLAFAQKKSLQLEPYNPPKTFTNTTVGQAWLKECKPAIYLYPKKEEVIHIKVVPQGYFTLTIPDYPKDGWLVTALPDGTIKANGDKYQYLYYESALKRSEVPIPNEGFVVENDKLQSFFEDILPKLGLNEKESADFIDYWTKALPQSPYYFVGLLNRSDIDRIEKLTVSPLPDSILRVRFYFKPLANSIALAEPVIEKQERQGFSVVEWGGIVDTGEKDFICSQ